MDRISLFDIRVSVGEFNDLINSSMEKTHSYTCFLNSHMVYEHHRNRKFAGVLDDSNSIFPDGMPIVYSLKILKGRKQDRVAGNDVIYFIINKAIKNDLKLFFIGGSEYVLGEISNQLKSSNVRHKTYSPPYLPIDNFDFDHQAKLIEGYDPDVVLVGLGCPKQEIWMNRMQHLVKAPMYGLGGAFLLYAGVDKRAPKIMRDLSLEWLYRFILEPKRLFKRYLITNTYFCYLFAKELMKSVTKRW